MSMKIDTRGLSRMFRALESDARKIAANAANHAAKLALVGGDGVKGAAQLTKKASAAQIAADLCKGGKALRLVQSRRARLPRSLQGFPGGKHTAAQVRAATTKLVKTRQAAAGSVALGFEKAAETFGHVPSVKISAKGLPGKSWGRRATPQNPTASFANMARGADKVAGPALQQGIENAMAAVAPEIERDLSASARRNSR